MISVCLATYNGAAYIEPQLRSILGQLGPQDEVILVDDGSGDATLERVRGLCDRRIKVHCNETNRGVVRTFERALSLARGDYIFLSDQDDLWFPDKVRQITAVFEREAAISLVVSEAKVIDGQGQVLRESVFTSRGAFVPGIIPNLIKNNYLGCSMALRRRLLDKILPFPPDLPMHDMWIGCINQIFGKVYCIETPLMAYRKHQNNASPDTRRGLGQILTWRWRLIKNLCARTAALGCRRLKEEFVFHRGRGGDRP